MAIRPGGCVAAVLLASLVLAGGAQAQSRQPTGAPTRQPSGTPQPDAGEALETLRRFSPPPERRRATTPPASRAPDPGEDEAETATPKRRSFSPKLAPVTLNRPGQPQAPAVEPDEEPAPAATRPRTAAKVEASKSTTPKTQAPTTQTAPPPATVAPAPPPIVPPPVVQAPPAPKPVPPPPPTGPGAGLLMLLGLLALLAIAAAVIARRMMMAGAAKITARVSHQSFPALEPSFAVASPGPDFAFRVRQGGFTSQADYPQTSTGAP